MLRAEKILSKDLSQTFFSYNIEPKVKTLLKTTVFFNFYGGIQSFDKR